MACCCREKFVALLRNTYPKKTTGKEDDLEAVNVGRLTNYAKRYPAKLGRISECVRGARRRWDTVGPRRGLQISCYVGLSGRGSSATGPSGAVGA